MKILVFTGAGVSAESGIDTFRTNNGIWSKNDLNKVCDYRTWRENYRLVHEFYNPRRIELANHEPNAFHHAVARWSNDHEVINLTQNGDDLFEKAGCKDVVHLHGFYHDMICEGCGYKFQITGAWNPDDACGKCGSTTDIKPDVVFFYQDAPQYARMYAEFADLVEGDIVIVAGTSEQVIAPSLILREYDSPAFHIHVNEMPMGHAMGHEVYDLYLRKKATESVANIDKVLSER